MQKPSFKLLPHVLWCILLSFLCLPNKSVAHTNETDRLALLSFKKSITEDPLNIMSSWNNSIHYCSWVGVSCSKRHPGRVTALKLRGMNLAGSLPPQIGNLSFLRGINLMVNSFRGEIPQEIGRLSRLIHLRLSINELQGKIPSNLSYCSDLQVIYLGANNLVGEIPQWLGNVTSLIRLDLDKNIFNGSIPVELGKLSKLQTLNLERNNLSGIIPYSLYNLSSLVNLSVAQNQLHGRIETDIGLRLPNLQGFYVAWNQFTGPLPVSLSNASGLHTLCP